MIRKLKGEIYKGVIIEFSRLKSDYQNMVWAVATSPDIGVRLEVSGTNKRDAREKMHFIINQKLPEHFPKPDYPYCNRGHRLVEVYNEQYNRYDWDCPICIGR